jgi:hypothetical protein
MTSKSKSKKTNKKTNRINSCIQTNQKTYRSVDFSTDCPKRRAGNPCPYCYVETARRIGYNAKGVFSCRYNGGIARMRQATIDKLNRCGGIRLFSFGDYMPHMARDVESFLNDCAKRGLKVKAITKQWRFVARFHDHKAIRVIHLSVDKTGSGVNHKTARAYRKKYSKVLVRCVALSSADVEWFGARKWIDIITLNHGANGFEQFRKDKRARIEKAFPGRVCCETGNCETCPIKCGKPESK